jgi:glycerophosphoryl diester phosphodiesterase
MLDGEEHPANASAVFTLAAYIHYRLTGCKVIGVGDAAGMFPIDSDTIDYDQEMVERCYAHGIICNYCQADTPEDARRIRQMGFDCSLTNDFHAIKTALEEA